MTPVLTVSKRFEFAASHKLVNPNQSPADNWTQYGDDSVGTYGHGHNFVAYFQFQGPIDPVNGMVVELSKIKTQVSQTILNRYDHFYLNDLAVFDEKIPTVEVIATQLLTDSMSTFINAPYHPSGVYLAEYPGSSAVAYASGQVERTVSGLLRHPLCGQLGFNSPLTVSAAKVGWINPETSEIMASRDAVHALTTAIKTVQNQSISSWIDIGRRLMETCDWASWLRVENAPWTATYFLDGRITMQLHTTYNATHRLSVSSLTESENIACFGKCYRPHGHTFDVMTSWTHTGIDSDQDAATKIQMAMTRWNAVALHLTPEFDGWPASTEWMIHMLWDRLSHQIPLQQIRLLETPNNRFSLRKAPC